MLNGQEPTGISPQDSVENCAEVATKVLAETHFQTKEEVQTYLDKRDQVKAEYMARLKEQFGIVFDYSDHRGDHHFIMVGDKKVYEWGSLIDEAVAGKLVEKSSSVNNILELPRETLLALQEYHRWSSDCTGKGLGLDAAVASGQIAPEKADEIKQPQTDDKVVASNADNFYFAYVYQTDKWQGDQIKWEVRDRKKE